MELTPEERKRIYLEEKARIEDATKKPTPKKSSRALLWTLAIIISIFLLGKIMERDDTPTVATKTPEQQQREAKAVQETYDACNSRLEKAKEAGMLYDIGGRGASIKVLVGPTYFEVPIDVKEGFAEVMNCVLVKGSGGGVPFELIHWQTGKRVASWNGYKLKAE